MISSSYYLVSFSQILHSLQVHWKAVQTHSFQWAQWEGHLKLFFWHCRPYSQAWQAPRVGKLWFIEFCILVSFAWNLRWSLGLWKAVSHQAFQTPRRSLKFPDAHLGHLNKNLELFQSQWANCEVWKVSKVLLFSFQHIYECKSYQERTLFWGARCQGFRCYSLARQWGWILTESCNFQCVLVLLLMKSWCIIRRG